MLKQLNKNMPTDKKNDIMEELFLAIYFNDVEKVKAFKNQYPDIYAKKSNFQIGYDDTFDLINLTFFNQTILKDDAWIEEIMPLILKNRHKTEQMLDYWRKESNCRNLQRKIEYNKYHQYFFCDDPNDKDSNEEIIGEPISNLLEKGYREIDLRLYNRVECFDFAEAEKLLKQGARMDIHFFEDGDSDTFSRISTECSYLATCHLIPIFEAFEDDGYDLDVDIIELFSYLIGMAAHQDMYDLLNKYMEAE